MMKHAAQKMALTVAALGLMSSFSASAAPAPNATLTVERNISPMTRVCDANQDSRMDEGEFMGLFRRQFNQDDLNGDASLSSHEMGLTVTLSKDITRPEADWTMAEFKALAFNQRDRDGDGSIAWSEEEASLSLGFRQIDSNQDGFLTVNELTLPYSHCRRDGGQSLARLAR